MANNKNNDDDFFEFDDCNIHPSTAPAPVKGVDWNVKTGSKKTTKQPSPYTKRQAVITGYDRQGNIRQETVDSTKRVGMLKVHDPSKVGLFERIIDKFRTKKVSGVIAIGAESVTRTKLSESFLRNEEGIKEHLTNEED